MRICKLTIHTSVDGESTQVVRMGKVEKATDGVLLRYREEGAQVSLFLRKEEVMIRREGDYTLALPLREGESTEGELGMGGSVGRVPIQTYLVRCVFGEEKIEIDLGYRLLFGQDAQDMRLKITALGRGGKS